MNFPHFKRLLLNRNSPENHLRLVFAVPDDLYPKAYLREAAAFSGFHKSQFSRFLKDHSAVAGCGLSQLSRRQARQFSAPIDFLNNGGDQDGSRCDT